MNNDFRKFPDREIDTSAKLPNNPQIISFQTHRSVDQGNLIVAEFVQDIPFEIVRTFWSNAMPAQAQRGHHAHYKTHEVLVAIAGKVLVETEDLMGQQQVFRLQSNEEGLYLPPKVWRTLTYEAGATLLVMASHLYDSKDYITDIDSFRAMQLKNAQANY
jgi:uncharacterized protein YdhG (YjbR/CyaY superfamily)